MATTTNATPKESLSAVAFSGAEMVCQKPCAPALCASQTSAAIGRRTMTKRNVETTPSERAVVALPLAPILLVPPEAEAAMALTRRPSHRPLDLDHAAARG
jgi:hypothetical protein